MTKPTRAEVAREVAPLLRRLLEEHETAKAEREQKDAAA